MTDDGALFHSPRPAADEKAGPATFERRLRAERSLNISVRLLWLMAELSGRRGYASMGTPKLSAELATTPLAVRQARQKLVRLGFFVPEGWHYHRRLSAGEGGRDWLRRLRADSRLDLSARCAWLLAAATRRGPRALSMKDIAAGLGTDPKRAGEAVRRLWWLGYFEAERGGGRGHKNVYRRTEGTTATPMGTIDDADDEPEDLDRFQKFARRPRPARAPIDGVD